MSVVLLSTTALPASAQIKLDELFITATGRAEPISRIVGTTQVINRETIERSAAKSVTELFAENAVGFLSEWTAGQTSLNIRGGATEGQGRDFKSQVLVLVNGHRAGTANISKLSLADVERIEIVRGPSSVVYGSQNMGGVVNIILKTGRTAPGSFVEASGGSWTYMQGRAQNGGVYKDFDWYVGISGSKRNNYHISGGREELNTDWQRRGATGSFGYQFDENNRVDTTIRSDGIYDAGFRGSSANLFAFDDRFNQSFDTTYHGQLPGGRLSWMLQAYAVKDTDDLNNPSPLSALNSVPNRTTVDHNRRNLDIYGTRFQPRVEMWTGNDLLLGIDMERSMIRSERHRAGGAAVTEISPQDNNQSEFVYAFYAEDAQRLFDDRLTVRGGLRKTYGTTSLDRTPFAPTLIPGSKDYEALTYSTGATFRFTDWLNGRVGASTGFRAPTATELGANFTITPIGTTIFGNPAAKPEKSEQIEAGATVYFPGFRFDAAVFQNIIHGRLTNVTLSSVGGVVIQQVQNNPGDIIVQGVEVQAQLDMIKTFKLVAENWRWSFYANGYYHFKMLDEGAVPAALSDKPVRIYRDELAIGTRFGQFNGSEPWRDWTWHIFGLLRGPMWYNTEESLSPVFFPGQNRTVTVYRKDSYWTWNTRLDVEVLKGVTLFGAVNNIFDINQHPIFIALDTIPCVANQANQNGSCGNSMPGREFIVGLQGRF